MDEHSDYRDQLWDYYDRRSVLRDEPPSSTGHDAGPQIHYALEYWRGLGVDVSPAELETENAQVREVIRSLDPSTYVEIGSGPGTYTSMLPGRGLALDQSATALRVLRSHVGTVPAVRADALRLPLRDGGVERVFAAHLYGILDEPARFKLLREVRRVAHQIIVLDAGRPGGVPAEHLQMRSSGSGPETYRVLRRHFTAQELADEFGGQVLFAGRFYVMVVSTATR
jgi:hypothetical protein